MIADALPNVPWTVTTQFALGLIGLMAVVSLVLTITLQCKKLWGRRPPIDEELDRRDKQIRLAWESGDLALAKRIEHEAKRIDSINESYLELQADRERKWLNLSEQIKHVCEDVAFIRGQMSKEHAHRRST